MAAVKINDVKINEAFLQKCEMVQEVNEFDDSMNKNLRSMIRQLTTWVRLLQTKGEISLQGFIRGLDLDQLKLFVEEHKDVPPDEFTTFLVNIYRNKKSEHRTRLWPEA